MFINTSTLATEALKRFNYSEEPDSRVTRVQDTTDYTAT